MNNTFLNVNNIVYVCACCYPRSEQPVKNTMYNSTISMIAL